MDINKLKYMFKYLENVQNFPFISEKNNVNMYTYKIHNCTYIMSNTILHREDIDLLSDIYQIHIQFYANSLIVIKNVNKFDYLIGGAFFDNDNDYINSKKIRLNVFDFVQNSTFCDEICDLLKT